MIILTELGKHFILTGQLDKKYGRFFARMIQLLFRLLISNEI